MSKTNESITPFMEKYLCELSDTPETLQVDFGGYVVRVESNSTGLVKKLITYFRDFLAANGATPDVTIVALEADSPAPDKLGLEFTIKQPDPGKSKIKEEWVDFTDGRAVRKRLTGMLFLFGADKHVAVGPCCENDNQVVNFINNRFIEWTLDQGSLLFHAAGVAANEDAPQKGLAMAGFSGMGKSTLALHIMKYGTKFVSNDRLMVKAENGGAVMYGLAKMPRINPGTVLNNPDLDCVIPTEEREQFENLPLDELWELEHKYDAFIDECYGPGKFILKSPMTGLVLLNWQREGDEPFQMNEIDITQRPDLMPAFMKSTGLFYGPNKVEPQNFSEQAYLDVLKSCPVYELTGKVDFEAAAKACAELLK